ncbi:FecR family protein [Cyclobacterium lianum]|uniref:FecR family protein n=1 Tax=Cyclobacterium lianum TaxID=388280 RepID=A0A1M7JYU8_9BACT|nr:FecR domain-containing protein [Cyclobacterium lianum]SHM58252.1 FecR family protein [Cyclobacterium lianum]
MKYKNYKVEDFVRDPWFRAWVNETNAEAISFWEKWIMNNPRAQDKVRQARHIILAFSEMETPMPEERKAVIWKAIEARTGQAQKPAKVKAPIEKGDPWKAWLKVALRLAASLLIILGSFYVFTHVRNSVNEIRSSENIGTTVFNKETGERERKKFKLPDGSLVFLNASSKLTYRPGPDDSTREVFLYGEAYFDVETDEARPFKVFANGTEITALGTEFNVKVGQSDSATIVSLVEGKVEVVNLGSGRTESVYLSRGERAFIDPAGHSMKKSNFDIEMESIWKSGLIKFQDTPMPTVKAVLEEWYGVEITFQNKHKPNLKVTGQFDNESLNNVLHSLGYTARFDYQLKDDEVYIKFKP